MIELKSIKLPLLLLIAFSMLTVLCKPAQTTAESRSTEIRLKKLLKSRIYRFIPQSVQTQSGRSFPVNSYSFNLHKDSLVSYLPYFGVAYSAPIASSRSPLDFTSTDFTYTSQAGKKGKNSINITLNDNFTDAQELYLDVSSSGYATLNVRFNNRQSISFYGQISEIPAKR